MESSSLSVSFVSDQILIYLLKLMHPVVSIAQMVGGIAASAILSGLTPGPLQVSVSLGQGTTRTQGLFIEMFVTAALTMSVLMLAAGE